jgi:hypothetical protein
MARGKSDLPPLPPSPLKAPARITPRSIDRPMAGLVDSGTPRELATLTRGPIKDIADVNRQVEADMALHSRRRTRHDYAKRPLMLKGSLSKGRR